MSPEDLEKRLTRFERTVATCLCIVPVLFSAQCFFAALSAPTFGAMFRDFGSKLPWPTQFLLETWGIWVAVSIVIPVASGVFARKGNPHTSILVTTLLGTLIFLIAQCLTAALFLPIAQLGAVAGGH